MSGIDRDRFISRVRESQDGQVGSESKSQTDPVNKGTLGNKIATWLKTGDESTRGVRTEKALDGFAKALKDFDDNDKSIKDGLTGRNIFDSVKQITGKDG